MPQSAEGPGLRRKELAQPVRVVPAQHAVRGAPAHAQYWTDAIGSPALLHAQHEDLSLACVRRPPRRTVRPTRSVLEIGAAAPPAIHGVAAHAEVARGTCDPETFGFAQQGDARQRRRAGGTVHSGPPALDVVLNTRTLVGGLFV